MFGLDKNLIKLLLGTIVTMHLIKSDIVIAEDVRVTLISTDKILKELFAHYGVDWE
jgi:hypothetical protein